MDEIRKEVVASVEDGDTKTAIELPGEARYRMELAVDPQLMGRWVLRDMPDRKEWDNDSVKNCVNYVNCYCNTIPVKFAHLFQESGYEAGGKDDSADE